MQIGHEIYEDILVRNGLCPSITQVDQLLGVIENLNKQQGEIPKELIFKGLGIKEDWLQNLKTAIGAEDR